MSIQSLLLLALVVSLVVSVSDEEETADKVFINVDHLPKVFSNDVLPSKDDKSDVCYKHIGCISPLINIPGRMTDPSEMKTEFLIYNGYNMTKIPYRETLNCLLSKKEECELYPFALNLILESGFDFKRRTVIITAGYLTKSPCTWQLDIKNRLLDLIDVNVILTSWDGGNFGAYGAAALNTKILARQTTVLLYYLTLLNRLKLDNSAFVKGVYLVGHSLGAHMSGFVGQDFAGKLGRITGLDPAGCYFDDKPEDMRLDRTDAALVDAIHTNGCIDMRSNPCYGTSRRVGHVDYYANNGQIQPACTSELFGCSHKIAPEYFVNFLDHELRMKNVYAGVNRKSQRLLAYASKNYEGFHTGGDLIDKCPISTLNDVDLQMEDIKKCSIPIDFVSKPSDFREELATDYKVNFEPSNETATRYYFYTRASKPYTNNHNLIRMRITKTAELESLSTFSRVCDIFIEIPDPDGSHPLKHKLDKYRLIDQGDHYEVIAPYMPPNEASEYLLLDLDIHDWYQNGSKGDNLLKEVCRFFPSSIRIEGLGPIKNYHGLEKIGNSIANAFRSLFGYAKKDLEEEQAIQREKCKTNVETVSIQPFKKSHRHMTASYSTQAVIKEKPDIVILKDGMIAPTIELFKDVSQAEQLDQPGAEQVSDKRASDIYLDTVVIGPHDDTIDRPEVDEEETAETDGTDPDNVAEDDDPDEGKTFVSGRIWLLLTFVLTLLFASIVAFAYRKWSPRIVLREDKRELIHVSHLATIS